MGRLGRKLRKKQIRTQTSWDGKGGYMKTDSNSVVLKFTKHHVYKGLATEKEIKDFFN